MSRGVLVLFIIAVGLGLYLWLVEMPTEQKRVETATAAKKLVNFQEEDVQALTIISSQGEVELTREKDGRWIINKPKTMEAETLAVEELLRTLLLAKVSRVVDEAGTDLQSYGLTNPSLTVSFRLASGTQTVRFGDSGPLSSTVYAMRGGSPKVLLTSLARQDLFTRGVHDLRRRRVFMFDRSQVTRLKVATSRETVVLYKEGRGEKVSWTIKAPVEAAADQPEVRSLLIGLEDLKAQDFLDDPKDHAATRARLGPPLATFTLREGETERALSLFIDPHNKRLAYAESTPQDPLYKVAPALAQDLAKGLFALRNKQLVATEPERVKTLVIKTGAQEYSVTRAGSNWLVDGDPKAKADAARLNMLVIRVVRLQAERIVTEKPTDLKPYGLAAPVTELIAADEQGKLLGRIAFGREEQGLAYALGSAMTGVFQVRPDILKEIPKKDELLAGKTPPQKKEGEQ
ncbi:MAG TPA: DUF4340 domain-containing protein [Nitrospirales bacterium]|nr:DUF4340 domain-containing protein [Nitrospirales bacterium]